MSNSLNVYERHEVARLGIVGTGRIAERFVQEAKCVSGVEVGHVYNPNAKSAKRFASAFALIDHHGEYEAFLDEVDAVYIATPHDKHYDYTRRALIGGKHVLCEKPMVLAELEARELHAIADENKLVLMEAVKTAYAPGFINLLAIARGGRIGTVYDVEAAFTKLTNDSPGAREYAPKVGGSFTELASYALLPIVKLLGYDYKELEFDSFTAPNGCDIYTKARFKYDRAIATAKTGIGVKSEDQLLISGSHGYILAKSPWWLLKSFEVCYEQPNENETFSAPFPGFGLRFEIADFVHNVADPTHRSYKFSKEDSIFSSGVIEKFLKHSGR